MIEDQAKDVIAKLATLFPDWAAWAGGVRTPDTIKAWQSALMSQEFSDVDAVVNDWQFGRKKAPEAFERERLIYLLVEAARVLKNNRYAKLESERVRENATATPEQIQQRRSEYRPIADADKLMGEVMRRKAACLPQIPRAQWTRQQEIQYIDDMNRIDAEYAKAIGCEPLPPLQYFHLRKNSNPSQQPEPQPAEEFYAWQ
jgi:hypothetical protein